LQFLAFVVGLALGAGGQSYGALVDANKVFIEVDITDD
jgi:hypothetical protein